MSFLPIDNKKGILAGEIIDPNISYRSWIDLLNALQESTW
jgi:hypothetical protein